MKAAMTLQGRFPSMVVRPPLRPLSDEDMQRIEAELAGPSGEGAEASD
jgi:dihydrodipicolinate synthase/N-acetylneuraminate lyase